MQVVRKEYEKPDVQVCSSANLDGRVYHAIVSTTETVVYLDRCGERIERRTPRTYDILLNGPSTDKAARKVRKVLVSEGADVPKGIKCQPVFGYM